jgi:hypothetical protein
MSSCIAFAKTTLSRRSASCSSNGKKDPTRAQITHARSLLVRSQYLAFLPIWSNQRSKGTSSSSASPGAAAAAGTTAATAATAGCDDEDENGAADDAADDDDEAAEADEAEEADGLRRLLGPCEIIAVLYELMVHSSL